MGLCDNEEFTADDRQILEDMLFPIFEAATAENGRPVSRDMIRAEIGKLWDWPQISSVLGDLEEKEYVETLSTRGGGVFRPGEKWAVWAKDMAPIEYENDRPAAQAAPEVRLTAHEARALVGLIRQLAQEGGSARLPEEIHARLTADGEPAAVLKILAGLGVAE